jgi:hypothetical protein
MRCSLPQSIAKARRRRRGGRGGFTLLEVALAMGLLFGMTFILLQITSTNLKVARALQRVTVDASGLAAELSLTNELAEGVETGDFGDLYPDHEWRRETTLVGTNGLFEVRFEVYRARENEPESELVILLYRPDSAQRAGGSIRR